MGSRFASDRIAIAMCDVCGFQYKLKELKSLVVKGRDTNIKACPECWNPDQPQLKLGEFPVDDPQAIRNPRPDDGGRGTLWNVQNSWITVDPTTLEETRHTTKYDDANRAWDLI